MSAQVKKINHYKGATKIPNMPEYMEDIINLRGKVILVIDLTMRFEMVVNGKTDRRCDAAAYNGVYSEYKKRKQRHVFEQT